jgi:(1->4)-alpha-D-glucan 1-alpha-D-glucosylmutase
MKARRGIPLATYRLQFNRDFTFRDAEALTGYLEDLGISHIYASPYLKARAGSAHGYDITDYNAINPEVGEEADFDALAASLHRRGMGQILDFVPNHMGVAQADNPWWLDMLEWGRASPYADYFDVDWAPAKRELRGKVLLPFLGDHYGRVLERGELVPGFDPAHGSFGVWYYEHLFPICPAHYAAILAPAAALEGHDDSGLKEALAEIAARSRRVRPVVASARRRAAARQEGLRLKRDLAVLAEEPAAAALLASAAERFAGTPGQPRSFLPLHRLLERQSYRLAYWRVAADEINYRRFFDINDLAGVRMEKPELFELAHRGVFSWVGDGKLDGVRIDHVDGLFDPAQYCRRLAARLEEVAAAAWEGAGDEHAAPRRPYLTVEKILARHESLRQDWPVDGTTGYETLNLINGLFVHPQGERPLLQAYRRFTGETTDFDEIVYRCKKHIMEHALASELQVLANELDRICESNWRTRDFTLARLRAVLGEVAACFPVYRTYVDEAGATDEDRQNIDWALSLARRRSPDPESTIFDFVHSVLTTDLVRRRHAGFNRRAVVRFAMRFQQFTSPVTAKALEDTSFYRFVPLISLNEVGGDPRGFGVSLAAFHHLNQERLRYWPHAMLATTTHDSKRSEDARMRIDVLSEMPSAWERQVRSWAKLNRRVARDQSGGSLLGRNDEYFLYQTMIGSWPNDLLHEDDPEEGDLEDYRRRLESCMLKAVREAKMRSSWAHPDEAYEAAVSGFVQRILDPVRSAKFLTEFRAFAGEVAWFGMLNSLSQTLLKLTVPGVPDIYQGAELWDYDMVDPDNRRPVDFDRRAGLLEDLRQRLGPSGKTDPDALRALAVSWTDGRIKLFLITRLLRLRRDWPDLFLAGRYLPLEVRGDEAERVCAFARLHGGSGLVVVAPRFFLGLTSAGTLPLGGCWGDTAVILPSELQARAWTDIFSGASRAGQGSEDSDALRLGEVLTDFPVSGLLAE